MTHRGRRGRGPQAARRCRARCSRGLPRGAAPTWPTEAACCWTRCARRSLARSSTLAPQPLGRCGCRWRSRRCMPPSCMTGSARRAHLTWRRCRAEASCESARRSRGRDGWVRTAVADSKLATRGSGDISFSADALNKSVFSAQRPESVPYSTCARALCAGLSYAYTAGYMQSKFFPLA